MTDAVAAHFDRLAARYSTVRAADANDDPVTASIVELGGIGDNRVLDVGRAYSTFALMSEAEYAAAEATLPESSAYELRLLNVVATRDQDENVAR